MLEVITLTLPENNNNNSSDNPTTYEEEEVVKMIGNIAEKTARKYADKYGILCNSFIVNETDKKY